MSRHLFGLVVTPYGTAANNRGENDGNITTLQKILWKGEVHTTVSAEAIRFAIRKHWQATEPGTLNRTWDEEASENRWADSEFAKWESHLDDDVLGFMSARAAREEANQAETPPPGRRARGTIQKRRARFEVSRAISLTPFAGDITFNAASPGATLSASSTRRDPVPYGAEVHATRYQYGFALTPETLHSRSRALDVVRSVFSLSHVAGNHARFLFDFSPDSIVLRWTSDFAPRILYGFESSNDGAITCPSLLQRVECGDVEPKELVIGGAIAADPNISALTEKGAFASAGVVTAREEIIRRLHTDLGIS
jgi:CRISPR-associated protein Cst2